MKTVLIVDDDPSVLEGQAEAFQAYRNQFRVFTAANGAEACGLLEQQPIDMLVTELEMPVMDGFELLAFVLQHHPSVSILVMSDYDNHSLSLALEGADSAECVTKPLGPATLVNRVRAMFARKARGHLSGVSLPGFLQLLHIEKRSCSLTVRSDSHRGTLEIFDGEIMNAVCDGKKGEEAAFQILSWHHPEIEMSGSVLTSHREIGIPLEQLLMEAARFQDETARDRGQPALQARWLEASAGEDDSEDQTAKLSEERREALARTFREVMMLDGAVGVALVALRSGRCLLSESRQLSSEFEQTASRVAVVVRTRLQLLDHTHSDNALEDMTIHLAHHTEIFRTFEEAPHLLLYFVGERSRLDEEEAATVLGAVKLGLANTTSAPEAPTLATVEDEGALILDEDEESRTAATLPFDG